MVSSSAGSSAVLPSKKEESPLLAAEEDPQCAACCFPCCRVDGCSSRPTAPVQLSFSHLSIDATVSDKEGSKRRIIDDVSGSFGPAEVVAIMGPSGGGKTTMLSTFSGSMPSSLSMSGELKINGQPFSKAVLRTYARMVPQDDMLYAVLTPREVLMEACNFHDLGSSAARARTEELLAQFNLTESKDVAIGDPAGQKGISGGQKKRLSVALELVESPSLLFLDEPTTGLDIVSATTLCKLLTSLAQKGATVITTIHQPSASIFLNFDRLMLLAGGKICYLGLVSNEQPVGFFESAGFKCAPYYNPADFVIEVLNQSVNVREKLSGLVQGGALEKLNSPDHHSTLPALQPGPPRGVLAEVRHFRILLWRNTVFVIREPGIVASRVILNVIMGLLIGGFWWDIPLTDGGTQDRITLSFFSIVFLLISTMTPTLGSILPELGIVGKEVANNRYSIGAYYLAKLTIELPLLLLSPLVYLGIMGPMTGFTDTMRRFWESYCCFGGMVLGAQSWTVLICSILPDMNAALAVSPVTVMPLMLFSGFFVNVNVTPWEFRWISYIDWVKYAWEMIAVAAFRDAVYDDRNTSLSRYPTGYDVITDRLGLQFTDYYRAAVVLGVWIVTFFTLAWVFLMRRQK